jgi:hypothetical protein
MLFSLIEKPRGRQPQAGPKSLTIELLPWLGVGFVQACANTGISVRLCEPIVVQTEKQATLRLCVQTTN